MNDILFTPGSAPNTFRIQILSLPVVEEDYITIHINRLDEVREETLWGTASHKDQLSKTLLNDIAGIRNGVIYTVYIGVAHDYALPIAPDLDKTIFLAYFRCDNDNMVRLSEIAGLNERSKQFEAEIKPLLADVSRNSNGNEYKFIFFYAGVDIHYPTAMKGITFSPIFPGLSNKSIFEAVEDYLLNEFGIKVPSGATAHEGLKYQSMFAIVVHKVIASSKEAALSFVTELCRDIIMVLATERADKPSLTLTVGIDYSAQSWEMIPVHKFYGGNMLPIWSSVANDIERCLPILRSRPESRLVLELYVEALSERDRSFRFLRYWTLLEIIAERHITDDGQQLFNLDGSPIHLERKNKLLTTSFKQGKVYAYLRSSNLSFVMQGTESGTVFLEGSSRVPFNGPTISLWELVAACNKIRNSIAHEGRFDANKYGDSERDVLCKNIYSDTYGFITHAAKHAVWREFFHNDGE